MKRGLLFSCLAFLFHAFGFGQEIVGDWYGYLEVKGNKMLMVLHVEGEEGEYKGKLDSPSQQAFGIPMDRLSFENGELSFSHELAGMSFRGQVENESIEGFFSQGGENLPLTWGREKLELVVIKRPQDPTDFPYEQRDLMIENPKAGIRLGATLTLPRNQKAKQIVVLISGSGPQDRNQEIKVFHHKPFLVWSDYLTRQGVAVLRYDDRGVAKSEGIFAEATSFDFSQDAEAMVNYIRSQPEFNDMAIGLIGHSEGGMIAPMVAARNPEVDFLVLLAGPGVPIEQLLLTQVKAQNSLSQDSEEQQMQNLKVSEMVYKTLNKMKDQPVGKLRKVLRKKMEKAFKKLPEESFPGGEKEMGQAIRQQLTVTTSPWFRYFVAFDPGKYLRQIKIPVLALNGSLDSQVDAWRNLAGIEHSLQVAGNQQFEIVLQPDLNHLFQKCVTGSVEEYGTLEETVNPTTLEKVANWTLKQTKN